MNGAEDNCSWVVTETITKVNCQFNDNGKGGGDDDNNMWDLAQVHSQ